MDCFHTDRKWTAGNTGEQCRLPQLHTPVALNTSHIAGLHNSTFRTVQGITTHQSHVNNSSSRRSKMNGSRNFMGQELDTSQHSSKQLRIEYLLWLSVIEAPLPILRRVSGRESLESPASTMYIQLHAAVWRAPEDHDQQKKTLQHSWVIPTAHHTATDKRMASIVALLKGDCQRWYGRLALTRD